MTNQRGFTLVELMVATAIFMLVLTAVFQMFISSNKLYTGQEEFVEIQQVSRVSLNMMVQDLRMAGLDPTETLSDAGITSANSTAVRIKYDYNGNGTIDRDRHYSFDAVDKELELQEDGAGGFKTLAKDIDSMNLTYRLKDNSTTSNPSSSQLEDIRTVTIELCGKIFKGSYSETFDRSYCYKTTVRCRNQGL